MNYLHFLTSRLIYVFLSCQSVNADVENACFSHCIFCTTKMEKLLPLNKLMHFSVRLKGFLNGLLFKVSRPLLLSVEKWSWFSSCSLHRPACGEMGSEERSSAMSQKISSLSRSNSSSSSKHDSRQVIHISGGSVGLMSLTNVLQIERKLVKYAYAGMATKSVSPVSCQVTDLAVNTLTT